MFPGGKVRQFLRFADGPARGDYGWTGEWPPPQQLWGVVGHVSGAHTVTGEEGMARLAEHADWRQLVSIYEYELVTHSGLPDDLVANGPLPLARGAEYRLTESASRAWLSAEKER